MRLLVLVAASFALSASAVAQPFVNGAADDLEYGFPDPQSLWIPPFGGNFGLGAIQDTQTDYGDADRGRPDVANGSELDATYGTIIDDTIYLVFAGNFENNGNELVVFFDTRAGGQNQLLGPGINPDIDFGALDRMGPQADDPETPDVDESLPGLKFSANFAADFALIIKVENSDPVDLQVNLAELFDAVAAPAPVGFYAGRGQARCAEANGVLVEGDDGAPTLLASLDNSNTVGVTGSGEPGIDDGSGVRTGLEVAIPLAALGDPTGPFELTAMITSGGNDDISSQLLGGLLGGESLGDPAGVDLSTTLHLPMQVDPALLPEVYGACCDGEDCTETTAAGCNGTFLPGVPCDGNPCDTTPAGACCIEDECFLMTAGACADAGGEYQGDDSDCLGCACVPPPTGACAVTAFGGVDCFITTEADCLAQDGTYAGDFSECTAFGIETPHIAGSLQTPQWVPDANPMDPGADENTWVLTFTGLEPNTRYEFKVTDGTWSNTFPGPNSWLFTDENGEVTITYDTNIIADGWLPNVQRLKLSTDPGTWTAAGSFQGWSNDNPDTPMVEVIPGIYKYEGSGLDPATDYAWKPVVTGSWDSIGEDNRSINTGDIPLTVTAAEDVFRLYVDALNARVKSCNGGTIGDANCDGAVDFFDIDPFVTALVSGAEAWTAAFGCDFVCANDINGDLVVDFFDIDPFVALLVQN
jgi:hypothetical protein